MRFHRLAIRAASPSGDQITSALAPRGPVLCRTLSGGRTVPIIPGCQLDALTIDDVLELALKDVKRLGRNRGRGRQDRYQINIISPISNSAPRNIS